MKDIVFIATKPLQILVAVSIIKQLGIERNAHLIIADSFYDAKMVYDRMSSIDWSLSCLSLGFKNSIKEAYDFSDNKKLKSIFIDTDVGLKKYIYLAFLKAARRNVRIHVYEEGIGTYRKDLYSGTKKILFDALGVATHFGGCIFTDRVYVFDDDRYRAIFSNIIADVIRVLRGIDDILSEEFEAWAYVMNYQPVQPENAGICSIYMSAWHIDAGFIEEFRKLDGDKFIKPHPHIRKNIDVDFARVISSTAPAELILSDFSNKYNKINVYHHGSSSQNYIRKKNINFLKIDTRI